MGGQEWWCFFIKINFSLDRHRNNCSASRLLEKQFLMLPSPPYKGWIQIEIRRSNCSVVVATVRNELTLLGVRSTGTRPRKPSPKRLARAKLPLSVISSNTPKGSRKEVGFFVAAEKRTVSEPVQPEPKPGAVNGSESLRQLVLSLKMDAIE
jgi:hypothetical protein